MSSGVTIEDVYHEIQLIKKTMVRRQDLESLIDTVEIMSNQETRDILKKSDADSIHGRIREISSVDDLLHKSWPCDGSLNVLTLFLPPSKMKIIAIPGITRKGKNNRTHQHFYLRITKGMCNHTIQVLHQMVKCDLSSQCQGERCSPGICEGRWSPA